MQAEEILVDTLRQAFENHLIPCFKGRTQILLSSLAPGEAAIVGAAVLVL